MRLIFRLVLRLTAIALACLVLTASFVMVDAHKAIEAETTASAERVAHGLENLFWRAILWRATMRRDNVLPTPDWESFSTLRLISPGVCISYAPAGDTPRTLCSQTENVGSAAPPWFSDLYESVFGAPGSATRLLTVRAPDTGVVVARADPEAAIRQAWRQISVVLSVAATMAFGICVLSGIAIWQALAPTRAIVDGLRKLGEGDYRHRIAVFTKEEFGLIAAAVNDLAERLAQTTAERVALTKRLFEVQEDERRALARDLHDEFGQCLTAMIAFAAAIESGAKDRPDLAEDARAISKVAKRMMASLRETLARLRSQDLEELGLEACLLRLAASWNARTAPKAVVHLGLVGDLGALPISVSTSVYRIAQECLTNAMRHGAPKEIHLRVERAGSDEDAVSLVVEDDGGGDPQKIHASSGRGILGVRERIAAFGGSLSICSAARGVRISARIPCAASRLVEA
jgi:two-component system sensor histidine kinase UhpB